MLLATVGDSLLHEGHKERTGVKHRTAVLRMILYPYIPAVVTQLDSLDQSRIGIGAGAEHPCRFISLAVLAIELKAMAVTLTDEVLAVGGGDLRARAQDAVVATETH